MASRFQNERRKLDVSEASGLMRIGPCCGGMICETMMRQRGPGVCAPSHGAACIFEPQRSSANKQEGRPLIL